MATHIKSLNIRSFRGVKNLEINGFADINIITGDNNTGKTSVLEVLKVLEEPTNISALLQVGRGQNFRFSRYDALLNLFNIDAEDKVIDYSIIKDDGLEHRVQIKGEEEEEALTSREIDEMMGVRRRFIDEERDEEEERKLYTVNKLNLNFIIDEETKNQKSFYDFERIRSTKSKEENSIISNIVYISPFRHVESDVFLTEILNTSELYPEMLEVLKIFDDQIISINADKSEHNSLGDIVYKILSKNHKKALPLNVYGDGMKKAILLISAIVKAKDGILLLDEFETSIHTSAMNRIFSWIINTCIKLNVQLFLTSHSEEAIRKFLRCEPEFLENMRVMTLMKKKDETIARILSGSKAIQLKYEYGMELR